MADKVQKIREEVEKRYNYWKEKESNSHSIESEIRMSECQHLLLMLDSQEEPVSEDLFEASAEYAATGEILANGKEMIDFQKQKTFIAGAEWQKAKDESTTEDLGDYINKLSKQFPEVSFAKLSRIAVRVSKWQKANLWKLADGNDLPEYDREVIVLTQPYPLKDSEYAVYFAHRPDPKGWDGKNITTGEVEHYTSKTYDKGGWNIPDVKYWLNVKFPKEIKL